MDVGIIARFKPLHNGAALMLDYSLSFARENGGRAVIGIGSANKYNVRNPFTPAETREMLDAYLAPRHDNYTIIEVPDFGHNPPYKEGQQWTQHVINTFGAYNVGSMVTCNPYVIELLSDKFKIIQTRELIPADKWINVRATRVREALARQLDWTQYVPPEIAAYICSRKLDDRFRREFGAQMLSTMPVPDADDCATERGHVYRS